MRVYVECYGCWLNKALCEAIKQLVVAEGGRLVDRPEEADAIILNTCAVRAESEHKALKRARALSELGVRVAVVGCLVNVRPYTILSAAPGASLIEPGSLSLISKFLRGEDVFAVRRYGGELLAPRYAGGIRYVIPIESGCTGSCGFCVEPVVRRGVKSLRPELVVDLVADAVKRGAREVYLTSQDLAAYGLDIGVSLPDLLEAILGEVDGEYRIRLGMMEPWLTKRIADRLASLMGDERVYKYLHLPVQSGDDSVLKLMRRRYTIAEYRMLVEGFRRALGEVSVVTDVIVGYPGETWDAFMRSVKLVEELRFDKVHVARYTFRPFTPAYVMDGQVPEPEKKRRSRILSEVAAKVAAEVNARYVGRVVEALVTDKGKPGTLVARTDTYKPVVIPDVARPGEWVKVRVNGYSSIHLLGEVLD
ncbi:MAG: tRNA (N(6)-L-threonylcarbamoyladenosine(37)-C(2))-methylthiotransferase [Thermoproteales archaeon]|nr:tRNA (N(6)-L-threonylcarbamoyladenosine(37)-C(2))-methylthiotransferase [Thermoproteales archaeon]